ncbi:NmrA family NAD(P)-binding protein [Flavobacterium selenitireducens]|uniref:NmrA family NAD(P)-binding protein n=1 Tax=Flavobacterium selenitireducens TaxID=2722704 RepID=UPI00168A9DD8|nr:NAD(P)H-binding protein [Flavobacterium selenitireducens]MBD3583684.1 NAD(P)H-binding protein [Flavobacterium selenitireducens]
MIVVSAATGHIGSELIKLLVSRNQEVIGLTSKQGHVSQIEKAGAKAAVIDIFDTSKLRGLLNRADKFYLLNPPGDISGNPSQEERQSVQVLIDAVKNGTLKKIVAESTYGAQPGYELGDLDVLYELEKKLGSTSIPHEIIRGAYYFSNWDMALESAEKQGKIYSFFPKDFNLPMVAPADIAKLAADRLIDDEIQPLHYVEGPRHYSPQDVADAFSDVLKKPVEVVEIPPQDWENFMVSSGFSTAAAKSMANMTQATLDTLETPDSPTKGTTTLAEYVADLVRQSG